MIILKIIMWIFVICLALTLLAILGILCALLVKVQLHFDYDGEEAKLKVKYGFIGIKLLPKKKKTEEEIAAAKAKSQKKKNKRKYKMEPHVRKAVTKTKESVETKVDKKAVEREILEQEDLLLEANRIEEEEARINAEMEKTQADLAAAEAAEQAGTPLPDVVDKSRFQKLQSIRDSFHALDFEKGYNTVMSFVNGFDFASALALIKFAGTESKGALGKVGKRIVFQNVDVTLGVHGPNTAVTALAYGAVDSVAVPALEKFVNTANVKKSSIDIHPEFLDEKDNAEVHVKVGLRPLYVVSPLVPLAVKVGSKAIPFVSKTSKQIQKNKELLEKKTEAKLNQQYAEMD